MNSYESLKVRLAKREALRQKGLIRPTPRFPIEHDHIQVIVEMLDAYIESVKGVNRKNIDTEFILENIKKVVLKKSK